MSENEMVYILEPAIRRYVQSLEPATRRAKCRFALLVDCAGTCCGWITGQHNIRVPYSAGGRAVESNQCPLNFGAQQSVLWCLPPASEDTRLH
jgi:hypothetical protein